MKKFTEKQNVIYKFLIDKPSYLKRSASNLPCKGTIKDKNIVLKSIRAINSYNKNTEKANKEFSKLTASEKRVSIAKDVIKQLKAGSFIAAHRVYVRSKQLQSKIETLGFDDSCELKSLLPTVTCECCAKGSLFLSEVSKRNKYKVDSSTSIFCDIDSETITNRLNNLFTKNQLDLIETAFEGELIEIDNDFLRKSKSTSKAIVFKYNFKKPSDVLIAIMENIITNKGTFKP